jgi:hypothetical protein
LRRRGAVVLAAGVLGAAAAPLVACALNFDRYDPNGAGAEASTDASIDDVWSNDGQLQDASSDRARADGRGDAASADASADRYEASSCTAPATCFQQATTCGSTCGKDYTRCVTGCNPAPVCTQNCTSTRQGCLGTCASTCMGCTQDAGCETQINQSNCLDAAHT